MKRNPPRRLAAMTDGDRAYRRWVHLRPCAALGSLLGHVCAGPIEQAHERDMTGLGLKAPERRSAPLCRSLYQAFDQHRAPFARWSKEARKVWFSALIEAENAAFERMDAIPW